VKLKLKPVVACHFVGVANNLIKKRNKAKKIQKTTNRGKGRKSPATECN